MMHKMTRRRELCVYKCRASKDTGRLEKGLVAISSQWEIGVFREKHEGYEYVSPILYRPHQIWHIFEVGWSNRANATVVSGWFL